MSQIVERRRNIPEATRLLEIEVLRTAARSVENATSRAYWASDGIEMKKILLSLRTCERELVKIAQDSRPPACPDGTVEIDGMCLPPCQQDEPWNPPPEHPEQPKIR